VVVVICSICVITASLACVTLTQQLKQAFRCLVFTVLLVFLCSPGHSVLTLCPVDLVVCAGAPSARDADFPKEATIVPTGATLAWLVKFAVRCCWQHITDAEGNFPCCTAAMALPTQWPVHSQRMAAAAVDDAATMHCSRPLIIVTYNLLDLIVPNVARRRCQCPVLLHGASTVEQTLAVSAATSCKFGLLNLSPVILHVVYATGAFDSDACIRPACLHGQPTQSTRRA
jgi:hypothetical protein